MSILAPSQGPLSPVRSFGLWHYVLKLLRLRLVILASRFRRARTRNKIGMIVLAVLAVGAFGLVFAASWWILGLLNSPNLRAYVGDMQPLVESVPVLVLGVAFIGILLTSFGVLLQALYLSGDMDFLLSAPLPIRAVFVAKLLEAILPNLSLIALFGLPVLFGLGASGGYNLLFYPLVPVVLVALALAAAGLAALLVMAVVRIFPARRVAEVLAFFGAIFSMLCSQAGNFSRFYTPDDGYSPDQIGRSLEVINRFNTPWSPLTWAGRGLVDIGEGRWLGGLTFILLTLGLAGAAFLVALLSAERLYYTGWASIQVGGRKKKTAPTARRTTERPNPFSAVSARLLSQPVHALVAKDFTMIRRDLRNMSQLLTPLILGIVYSVMIFRPSPERGPDPNDMPAFMSQALSAAETYGSAGIGIFVGWILLARLAMTGFSQEGKSYWLLKTAPLSARQLLLAKFLTAYLPSVALSWAFVLAIVLLRGQGLLVLAYSLLVVSLCMAGAAGINLAFGVRGANLGWSDPRQMSRGTTGCLSSLVSMAYLPIDLGLFFLPPVAAGLLNLPEAAGQALGLLLGGGLALACTVLPLWLVRKDVARIGED